MSIENSIDRLAAAIEKLANAVAAPVVVAQPEHTVHELDAMTYAKAKEEVAAADAAAKKPRGRPRKQGNVEKFDLPATADHPGYEVTVEKLEQDPQPAAQTADTATAAVGSTAAQTSDPATATSESSQSSEQPSISKGDIVQILTGLQKKLEESATTIEEKRGAAQKCRDLIKSVVGSESLKDAKPEHFGLIKSAVLKVLNNE